MKPHHLTIQAFGPFSATQHIDFNQLGANPLFLINGPTGAGKSSILDAISFALYGQTTGAERTPSQMRCDHANANLLTKVSLEFSIGDKKYKIMRIPAQERVKKNGEGTTLQQAEATLWSIDRNGQETLLVPKKVLEADLEIKSLLGLNVEQFRQVMVLPQGKFRDLLLADSKDREKIFSQLFQTSVYKKIEEKLKSDASEIRKKVDQQKHQILGIIKGTGLSTEEEVGTELQDLTPKRHNAEQAKNNKNLKVRATENSFEEAKRVSKQFATLFDKKETLKQELSLSKVIEKQESQLNKAVKAQRIYHLFDNKNQIKNKVIDLEKQLKYCVEKYNEVKINLKNSSEFYDTANVAYANVDTLKTKKAQLTQFNALLLTLNSINEALISAKLDLFGSKQKVEAINLEIAQDQNVLTTNEQATAQILKIVEALSETKILLEKATQVLIKREKLDVYDKDFEYLDNINQQLIHEVEKANESYLQAQLHVKQVEYGWHSSQASLLAQALNKNDPCPVCGSKVHPCLATTLHKVPFTTKEDVDEARVLEKQHKAALDQLKVDLSLSNDRVKTNKQQSLEMLKTLGTIADKSIEQLNCEKTNLKVKLQKLQLTHQELTDSIALCEKLKQNIQTKIEAQKQLNAQVKINNEAVIAKQASLQQIKSQIPSIYQESGVVEQSISSVNSEIEILSSNLNLARSQLGQVKSDFDKTETQKISLENQVKSESKSKQLIDESWLVALKNSQFDSQAMFKEAILDEDTQQKMEKNITEYRQHIENLSAVIIQLEQDLCDQKEPDLIALENMLNQEKDELKSYESTWRKLDERHNLLRHVQILLAEAHKQNESLETQYNTIGTLYEVSNGLTGKKISLQRFVLSVLLDDVLIQASVRLSIMSKGRYQLVRKSDRAKGNKASGLELEVDDAYTGKIRSVATLSGGESFLAALSLALGVSDVVQSYAGGVKLETLFIDEGFGSLDPDALELTIRALIDLQSSGRMIGVISHVTELKEQMALRIDVTSGKFGSEISILNQEH